MKKEQKLNLNLAEYTDEKLYGFRDWIQTQNEIVMDEWATELKEKTGTVNFDPYSFSGERKLKKIAKKYAGPLSGLEYLQELVGVEIAKRNKYKEEQRYIGRGEEAKHESLEEFLQKEAIKTKSYKNRIED